MGQGLEESGLMRDMRCQGILGGDKPAGSSPLAYRGWRGGRGDYMKKTYLVAYCSRFD